MSKSTEGLRSLLTPWGARLNRDRPWAEYPRPQLRRASWQCLNGLWDYAIRTDATRPDSWDGEILVPFSPESELSGVRRQLLPGQTLWYRTRVYLDMPRAGERLLLHFGAVDQHCVVYVNGRRLGSHAGGYWPFSLDATALLVSGENTLELRVTDDSDTGDEAYGKQKLRRGGIWYTAQSGLWQSVWCERVPAAYIRRLRITPDIDAATVTVALDVHGETSGGEMRVLAGGAEVARTVFFGDTAVLDMPEDFRLWSPDDPVLYDLDIVCGEDSVRSYFGMRSFGTVTGADGHTRPTLNGKPILMNGLLDQGYWSDGLYTPPSDEAMVWELETIKSMGYNMLRKHIKIEPLRWYYHCDRLGILVWQDFVSGGGPYYPAVVQAAPFMGLRLGDRRGQYALHGRKSERGREIFLRDARRTLGLLANCVSLCVWVPFNEGWGQFESLEVAAMVKGADPTRLIDHASGYFDQGGGDFCSQHVYFKPYKPAKKRGGRILALTEFGGYSLSSPGHMASERLFGYKSFDDAETWLEALQRLCREELHPAVRAGLSAIVYTQLSDVEDEINGLLSYDRRVIKPDLTTIQDANRLLAHLFAQSLQA